MKSLIPSGDNISEYQNSQRLGTKYGKTAKVQPVKVKENIINNKSMESNKFYKEFENLSKQKNSWTI